MTVSETHQGAFSGVQERPQSTPLSRLDAVQGAGRSKAERRIARARAWLKSGHRSGLTWARIAADRGLSSRGMAQHIAAGRSPVPGRLLTDFDELQAFREAGRWLAGRIK